ncbi:2-C-methyl-D-erythritol 2,4-cyclodiphosphate synthase [Litoribrevibacter albus]|uniref:2-C-methyl-D-erythritol 2,4-cyclodiphosphate synthase n=1 Tax=Litoribrevibacter albus TaxID=1473156 RepID=A0AA37S9T3_9GAMM|nr:2-C-methyl-D-erythritol 2,4-cyclodiphosphate synthase [Litoribrevibacter albus]
MGIRIGHGYDVHAFGPGELITLGGVKISHTHGFVAHSDGDVLIHALCDALLGAAALGDIGQHFPDTSSEFENIDSRKLLRHVMELLKDRGYWVINVDCTIVAQAPKMAPHIDQMRVLLASDLAITQADINVKATTTEKLGFVGRKEGVEAHAVVLIANE